MPIRVAIKYKYKMCNYDHVLTIINVNFILKKFTFFV